MKAISILQPWASLIVHGLKRYETRSWQTRHRGPLLICASARFPAEFQTLCAREPFRTALQTACGFADAASGLALPTGCIFGTVLLTACHPTADGFALSDTERAFGDFGPARYAWELTLPRRLPAPIPYRGALGLFEIPDALIPEEFR
jgi:hypothetical protein